MAKTKTVKLPTKENMNLYQNSDKSGNGPLLIASILTLIVVSFLVLNFGVIKTLQDVNQLQSEVDQTQTMLDECNYKLQSFSAVKEEYLKYSDSYATDTVFYADRIKVLQVLENACTGLGEINSVVINENIVTAKVTTTSLSDFDRIKNTLDRSEIVKTVVPVSHDDASATGIVTNVFRFEVIGKEVDE